MLFSHPDVARILNESFECTWESVRPVPKVEIDFGDGHKLRRTLHGNIVTFFCTPDGEVFDALAGLYGPEAYVDHALLARRFYSELAFHTKKKELVAAWHARGPVREEPPARVFDPADLSKTSVERRIESVVTGLVRLESEAAKAKQLADAQAMPLEIDEAYNRREREPKTAAILRDRPLARPAELSKRIYLEVLRTDLSDPYLGLAPAVLGGELGRE